MTDREEKENTREAIDPAQSRPLIIIAETVGGARMNNKLSIHQISLIEDKVLLSYVNYYRTMIHCPEKIS